MSVGTAAIVGELLIAGGGLLIAGAFAGRIVEEAVVAGVRRRFGQE